MIFNNSAYSKRCTSKRGNDFFRIMLNKEDIAKALGNNSVLVIRVMDQNMKEDKNGNKYCSSFVSSYTPKSE